jgi:pseudoazurin
MTQMKTVLALFAIAVLADAQGVYAEEFEIQMLNRGEQGPMVFEPAFLHIQPGDTVTFVPTNPSHNVETIEGMLPDGVEPFKSNVNKTYMVTFDIAGAYGLKCTPHYALGMIALIVVGDEPPANLEALKSVTVRGRAKQRFADIFEAQGL